MSKIVCIEGATQVCSVALSQQGKVIDKLESLGEPKHASLLTTFIKQLLTRNHCSFQQLDAIAVGTGPGSYTGLRVATSVGKALAYALNIPLLSVSTLKALAQELINTTDGKYDLYVPMIDARRMEVYTAIFDAQLVAIEPIQAHIVNGQSFQQQLTKYTMAYGGNGAEKCQESLTGAFFVDKRYCSAAHLVALAFEAYEKKQFADLIYYKPNYFKQYLPSISNKNVL